MVASESKAKHPFAVDERLIMPETRYEVIDGQVVYVSPALPPHASRHAKLLALLEAYVVDGYDAACDMLTRTSEKGDMAPDGSIYSLAPDPETGGRQLEELAFEVVSTETLGHSGIKAARLSERGVRRVFAVDVERKRALEWSTETQGWQILRNDDCIDDPTLVTPLPIAALVGAADEDDAVVKAMVAKNNPVIVALAAENEARGRAEGEARGRAEGEARGRAEGEARGRAETLVVLLRARGFEPTPEVLARIDACRDSAALDGWVRRAATAASLVAVFED